MKTSFTRHYSPLALVTVLLLPAANSHAAGETTLVSVDSEGQQGNEVSSSPSISADGRYVAFTSNASNLAPGSNNWRQEIYVHDLLARTTSNVSINSNGEQANHQSNNSSISADGRYVAFHSSADNLVPGDTNKSHDVFVHDCTTHITTRVSVSSQGDQGNDDSANPSISADGRYVAFSSGASNLVPGDTDGETDSFVHDRLTGKTKRVSVDSAGHQGYGSSFPSSISADGRYVAFTSGSRKLVPADINGKGDAFVHDQTTGKTTLISVDSSGEQGNEGSYEPAISADGRYVAFWSAASNLVPGDTNGVYDVFVHDRTTGETTRISVQSDGRQVRLGGYNSGISADGRYVTFHSQADNLVPGDTNASEDVFVHDRLTGKTTLVSIDSAGEQGNDRSFSPAISADGRYVAFLSGADNLVPRDTNQTWDVFVRDRWLNTAQSADLQLTVTSEPATVQNGDVGRYLFTITNNGPDNIDAVRLIDSVSGGKVWSLTPSQGYCSEAAVSVCRLHKLAAGESATVRTVFKAKGNPLIQKITVNGEPADSDPDNNRVTVSTPVTP